MLHDTQVGVHAAKKILDLVVSWLLVLNSTILLSDRIMEVPSGTIGNVEAMRLDHRSQKLYPFGITLRYGNR